MARYDKYDPKVGGFRAALAADHDHTNGEFDDATHPPIGVGLDNAGHVVDGAGVTGVLGLLCLTKKRYAGEVVDVMTDGEVTGWGGDPATIYGCDAATGVVAEIGVGDISIGWTVEAGHLVVRFTNAAAPPPG